MVTKILLNLVFVAIVIMPATTNAEDPTAATTTTDVTTAGGTLYSLTVQYADDGLLDFTSLGDADVHVNGPNGYGSLITMNGNWKDTQQADSQFSNISTRGFVETGTNVMIGGFILGGESGNANVVVRALGPSLTAFGVSGVLADPTLELHDGNGALVQSNDNWKETQQTEIEATGLEPTNDLESAVFETLAPGAYTAVVAGKDDLYGSGSGGSLSVALVSGAPASTPPTTISARARRRASRSAGLRAAGPNPGPLSGRYNRSLNSDPRYPGVWGCRNGIVIRPLEGSPKKTSIRMIMLLVIPCLWS